MTLEFTNPYLELCKVADMTLEFTNPYLELCKVADMPLEFTNPYDRLTPSLCKSMAMLLAS